MNTRKLVKYAVFYSVGVYAIQRLTGKSFGLPAYLDPLSAVLGPAVPPALPAPVVASTGVPAVITAAAPMTTS